MPGWEIVKWQPGPHLGELNEERPERLCLCSSPLCGLHARGQCDRAGIWTPAYQLCIRCERERMRNASEAA